MSHKMFGLVKYTCLISTSTFQTQTKEPTPKNPQQAQIRQANNNRPAPKRASLDEAKLEEEWDSLPLWKREIMMKRGGAPTNWGNENSSSDENDE